MIHQGQLFRLKFNIGWLLVAFFFITLVNCYSQTIRDKEKLQQTKQKLEEEIRYTNDLLEKTQKNKAASMNKLQILAKQIKSREALIKAINRELNDVEITMAVDSIQIGRMSQQLQVLKAEYARMIRYAYYTMNRNNKLMFIFSASDFNQAYLRLKYYQQYASFRRRQAVRIEATQAEINAHRKKLEDTRVDKLALFLEKQEEKQKLDREKTDKANAVKELSAKEKQLLSEIRTKQQSARKLESAIQKLIADDIKTSDDQLRKKSVKEQELSSSFSANKGRLPWPCDRGFVSEGFGEHTHSVLKNIKVKNNGIDILTEPGASVKSIFGGKVSRVMSLQSFNHVVIIRHGEYLTVYSNLDEVNVRDGQEVSVKQVVGKVHSGPGDQKSELHFELWHGKVIQDPEAWLTGR